METMKLEELNNYLLFRLLDTKLGPGMLRKETRRAAAESHGSLKEAIETYFRLYILWDVVSVSIGALGVKKRLLFEMFYLRQKAAKNDCFYQNGIESRFCEGLADELLGTAPLPKAHEILTEKVEAGIKDACTTIAKCCDDSLHWKINDKNWAKTFQKIIQQQSLQLANLDMEQKALHLDRKKLDEMILNYFNELSEEVSLLYELASLRESSSQFGLQLAHLFSLRCLALLFKMKIAKVKALHSTYTEESIAALKKIRIRMGERAESASAELSDSHAALGAYRLLGENFQELAAKYSELATTADRLSWSIDALLEKRQSLAAGNSTD